MGTQDQSNIVVGMSATFDASSLEAISKRITSIVDVMKRTMKESDSDFHNYYKNVEELASAVRSAYDAFARSGSEENAKGLVKAVNALQAIDGDVFDNLARSIPQLSESFGEAERAIGALASAFSVDNFKRAFSVFDTIKDNGGDVAELFTRIGQSADTAAAMEDKLRRLGEAYSDVVSEADGLKERIRKLEDDSSVGKLTTQLKEAESELTSLRSTALEEFKTYLRSNDIDPYQTDEFGDRVFGEFFDNIRNGSITAKQAIASVKREFASLFDDRDSGVGADALGEISMRLDDILTKYEQLSTQIREAGTAAPMDKIGEAAESGAEAVERQGEVIREVAGQRTAIADLNDLVRTLVSLSHQAEGSTSSLYDQIVPMLDAIKGFDTIDASKLESIGSIFGGLSGINGFKVSQQQTKNLEGLLNVVSQSGDLSKLRLLSGVNFTGLNNLNMNGRAVNNFKQFIDSIEKISTINIDELNKIAGADFSTLGEIKLPEVSDATLSSIEKMSNALSTTKDVLTSLRTELDLTGKAVTQSSQKMASAGISHTDLSHSIKTGLGSGATKTAGDTLRKVGLSDDEIKEMTAGLESMQYKIKDVSYEWVKVGEGAEKFRETVIHAVDETGKEVSLRLHWEDVLKENEEGVAETTKVLVQNGKVVEDYAKRAKAAAESNAKAMKDSAEAEIKLADLRILRNQYQEEIDRANEAGISTDTTAALDKAVDDLTNIEDTLTKISAGEAQAKNGMKEYADSITLSKKSLTLLKGSLDEDIEANKTLSSYIDDIGYARTLLDDVYIDAEGTWDDDVRKLREAVKLYDTLDLRLQKGSISQDEFNKKVTNLHNIIEKATPKVESYITDIHNVQAELYGGGTELQRRARVSKNSPISSFGASLYDPDSDFEAKAIEKTIAADEKRADRYVANRKREEEAAEHAAEKEAIAAAEAAAKASDRELAEAEKVAAAKEKKLEKIAKATLSAEQAESELIKLESLRLDYQKQIDAADAAGVDTDTVKSLKQNLSDIGKVAQVLDSVQNGTNKAAISTDKYKKVVGDLSEQFKLLKKQLATEMPTGISGAQADIAKETIKAKKADIERQISNFTDQGYGDSEEVTKLQNMIPLYGALNEKVRDGAITYKEYADTLRIYNIQSDETVRSLNDRISAEKKEEVEKEKAYRQEMQNLNIQKQANEYIGKASNLLRDYSAAEHSRNESSRKAYASIKEYKGLLEDLYKNRESMDPREFARREKEYTNKIEENSRVIEANGDAHMTAFGKIGKAIKTHLTTLTATASIGSVMRYIRQMIDAVKEIDSAMTELKKVTDETDARYEKFLTDAATRAKNLSATISDTVNATANFARLGLSLEDAEMAADAAIVYKSVGDGINSIDDAAESIISTMKAFGIEANDAMSIVDKFNEVGKQLCPAA